MKNITITAENMSELITEAFGNSLFKVNEEIINAIKVDGLDHLFEFHLERLEQQRETIKVLVEQLPESFKRSEGDSFLKLTWTKNNEKWTDDYIVVEKLMLMAVGLELAEYSLPKRMWYMLPSSLPYLIVK